MPATWPATLPQLFQVQGNQLSIPGGRISSQTDTGPGKMRPRSSSLGRPLAGTMLMTAAQWEILDAFVANDLALGSLPFIFPATYGGGTWLVRFNAAAGALPALVNVGADTWTVAFTIDVLP